MLIRSESGHMWYLKRLNLNMCTFVVKLRKSALFWHLSVRFFFRSHKIYYKEDIRELHKHISRGKSKTSKSHCMCCGDAHYSAIALHE